jgi:hypothetical protein
MQLPQSFDPREFNFVLLQDFRIPGDVSVYEFHSHPIVNGKADFLRLNLYLTKDGNYVTIWSGLLETLFTEAEFDSGRMASVTLPHEFDFTSYNQDLFRGYIDSCEAAGHIFKALRISADCRHLVPQVLSSGPDGKLKCDLIGKTE